MNSGLYETWYRTASLFGKNWCQLKKNRRKTQRSKQPKLPLWLFVFFSILISLPAMIIPVSQDIETLIPLYAGAYTVSPQSCGYLDNIGTQIKFKFSPIGLAQNRVPSYDLQELPKNAQTMVTFHNISLIKNDLLYDQVINNPLIESIDYSIKGNDLVIMINRKNNYLAAQVDKETNIAVITLKSGDNAFPKIFDQKPAPDSAAFPAMHPISFKAALNAPLRQTLVFIKNKPVQFNTAEFPNNEYEFSFKQNLEKDQEYPIKVILSDIEGRVSVFTWNFIAQIPSEVALGKDRFKYLGWWGQINTNRVNLRENTDANSNKIGTLSSANRVKILKEVYGQWIDGKNLWYQIDGGQYPGAYIFSDYVTPIKQPQPPQEFAIPENVKAGENWIDVDLTQKIFTLFNYDKPIFATYISPGRTGNLTETGTFQIWYKLAKAEMRGGPPLHSYRYDLKDIPWTMFYNYDYAIHGTYWHDRFGYPQSAGCTNMTQGDAKFIFDNTLPAIPKGRQSIFATDQNPGTTVHNHY